MNSEAARQGRPATTSVAVETSTAARRELLEQHGRAYGRLRLALTFTESFEGEGAKRVRATGWNTARPLDDPEQAAAILRVRGEKRNPAVVLRPSGLVGIDVDGPEGVELVQQLAPEGLPVTVTVLTGRTAGYHGWYQAPDGAGSAFVQLGPEGVEVKTNQYLVAPPAVHPSGRVYRFADGRAPWDIGLAVLPLRLLERFERAASVEKRRQATATGPIVAGGRHDYLMLLSAEPPGRRAAVPPRRAGPHPS